MSLKKQMSERLAWKAKMDRMGQTCKVCGKRDKFDFHVPDEIWEAIVPPEFRNRVVCLACFDNFAFEKNINYAKLLDHICFAGDQACFGFNIEHAINVEVDLNSI